MHAREFIPGADRKAIIAAIDAIAHRLAKFLGDRAVMFDRQVGNAAPRIQAIRRGKGARWADIQAARASAAMINLTRVWAQIQSGVNLTQE